MQDVIQYLKKLQGLLERSVNGNQQTHNLLNSMNDNSKRTEQLLERIAVAAESLQTSSQHMEQLMEESWKTYNDMTVKTQKRVRRIA